MDRAAVELTKLAAQIIFAPVAVGALIVRVRNERRNRKRVDEQNLGKQKSCPQRPALMNVALGHLQEDYRESKVSAVERVVRRGRNSRPGSHCVLVRIPGSFVNRYIRQIEIRSLG
jgi:hypothetical protein